MPALRDPGADDGRDFLVADSSAIVVKAGGAMFFNRLVAPKFLKRPGDEAAAMTAERDELPPILAYLERTIPDGAFLVGDAVTVADVAVASPFVNMAHVGVCVDAARWPRTAAYLDAILARPGFAGAIAAERRLIAGIG